LSIETTHDEGICFSLDKTVALALMINEIVTNAYKHAFPDGQRGTITLNAAKAPDGGVIIQVSDDGIGMEGGNPASGGLGTTLMEALAGQFERAALSKTETIRAGRRGPFTSFEPPSISIPVTPAACPSHPFQDTTYSSEDHYGQTLPLRLGPRLLRLLRPHPGGQDESPTAESLMRSRLQRIT
jgi:hypothetical protein